MFFITLGYAQEDCVNGIDDDGDGLIDDQDPECAACYAINYSLIEEDFEDYNCCPSGISQTNCINGWQAFSETPDYLNTCDYIGGSSVFPIIPQPIPSGEGAVGLGSWYETVGICLGNILLAGESYDISFFVGFNSSFTFESNLNVEISLFGTDDCDNIDPFAINACDNPDWYEIATFTITGVENDSWMFFSTSFNPNFSASAISIGHSCNFIDIIGTSQYHFLDDIQISGNVGTFVGEIPEISYSGDCIDGVFIESNITNAVSYQWFLDGEVIPGAISNPFQIDITQFGMYQVSVLDNIGCTLYSEPLLIDDIELEVLDIESDITPVSCDSGSDGIIEVLIDSPNLPYNIVWSDGSMGPINDNLAVGTYTVTVTDNNGCFAIETYEIQVTENVDAAVSGDCVNGVFISVEEIPGASYQWYLDGNLITDAVLNPYQVTADFPGEYYVTIDNGIICTESNPLIVDIDFNVLGIEGEVVDLLCFGATTGSIDIIADDMNPPLTYSWNNGEDTEDITDLGTGTYVVTVIDANGCFGIMDFIVNGPSSFINSLTVVQPDMGNPGGASIASSGGILPYTYEWNNGFDQSSDDDLAPGEYAITVTDGNGCIEIFEFEITSNFIVIEMFSDESCPDACDGSILLTVDDSNSVYSVIWDSVDISGFNPTQLCAGIYAYTVTDSEESPFVGSVTISAPPEIMISAIYEDTICANSSDQDISLLVSGGTLPYTYLWNTGSVEDTLVGVDAGTYIVEVTDNLGCIASDTFEIDSLPMLELQFEIVPTGCNGEEIGAIDMTINNGIAPINILWNNDSITEDLIDLADGWYSVSVTDGYGCLAIDSAFVNSNSGILVSDIVVPVNCIGEDNGSISLEISGGLMPYDIEWDNGADSTYIENLSPGFYEVTILDAAGCSWFQNYEILLNSDIDISAQTIDNVCYGESAGSIELTINNVFTSYTINWEDGSLEKDRYNIPAGVYHYMLIDSFGCTYLDSFIISEGLEINYQVMISEPSCNGVADGLIGISPVSGALPFSYLWSNGETVNQINDLVSATYYLTITDDNGCIELDTFILSENSDIEASESIMHNLCYGESKGSIELDIIGGALPYIITWSNGENTSFIDNLLAGDYFVTIEDGNGCNSAYLYMILEPDSLYIEDFVELPLCHNDVGNINVDGQGGIEPYTINWSTGETTPSINITHGNTYMVTLTDMNQCTNSKTYIIDNITEIEIITTSLVDPTSSNNDGSITIDVSGGTSPYTISWDNGQTGVTAINLGSGFFTATVVDANGCTQTITVELSNDPLSANGLTEDNLCFGDCKGQVMLSIEGGTEPYIINWSDGQSGLIAESLCNGDYQATIIDGLGEEFETEVFPVISPNDIIIDGQTYDISCAELDDGAIAINSEGGENPFDYNWSNSMIGDSIGNLSSGEYSVTVMDINGCSESETYTIEDIPLIDIDVEVLPFDCNNANGTIILKGENTYDYPYYLNDEFIEPNDQDEIENLVPGTYQLSYVINETCIIEIDMVDIKEQLSNNFEISSSEFIAIEGDKVLISLDFDQDSLLSYYTIDWSIINSSNCLILNTYGQCMEMSILVQESEIVQVVIIDIDGCETILKANIVVEDRESEIFIPNIFSPNDDGVNDEFTISSNDEELFIESMQIFDRWGNIVYSHQNIDLQNYLSWNGEFKGRKVTTNVFVYRIEFVDKNGEAKILFGDLVVMN